MITYEQILALHDDAIREHGGSPGVLNESAIHSAIGRPYQTFDGVDLVVGIAAKAASLGFGLVKGHGFNDGNKRVGFMAMVALLFMEGYHLITTPNDGEHIILSVVEGVASLDELTT